ncbi:transport and Golgi organization 2 homolog [Pecten maximus]|uniref:transport and Golgi organization 2 homolog n=1 Tax=Pecten maximus TaxID=6579 RepID=UPI0014586095|nr:transport and Golgi organization 2 homolog [Pecten maximus]
MCLLFLHVCDTPDVDGYRLILANNRDEYWDRETAQAHFWDPKEELISGLDKKPGKDKGTWLGMSKFGKIGALLNIPGTQEDKMGRGMLILEYLKGDLSTDDYITQKVQPIHKDIKTFNLILIDLRSKKTSANYYNNKTNTAMSLPNGVYSFDNSVMGKAWQKTIHGEDKFRKVVHDHGRKGDKDRLVQSIFDILYDTTRFPDDDNLMKQANECDIPDDIRLAWSAAFVWSPSIRHGTRTNTVILVDKFGECQYIERTLNIPVNPDNLHYSTNSYQFHI